MGKIVLMTGGARSGKSTYAEKYLADRYDAVSYIATAIPFDDEMRHRIAKHQAQRPSHWATYEAYRNLEQLVSEIDLKAEACLLDCLTILVTNYMMDATHIDWDKPEAQAVQIVQTEVLEAVEHLLVKLKSLKLDMVFVTNELGMGIVPENPMARAFRDIAGRVNQLVAGHADEVYLLVCGLPMVLKTQPSESGASL